jgi:hypothetical protein
MQQAVAARAPARVIPLFRDTASDEAEPTAASSG